MERNLNLDKNYYNDIAFKKALKIMDSDPYHAEREFREYLAKYPKDYYAMTIYVSHLITLQQFDLAEQLLDELELKIENDKLFAKNNEKKKENIRSIFYARIKLLSYRRQFKELYEHFLFHPSLLNSFNIDGLILYCHKQLGIPNKMKTIHESYVIKQILDYNEERMKVHLEKHIADNNVDEQHSVCVFSPEFPIKEIIEEVKKYIPSEKKLCQGLYDNHYIFEYESCGKVDRKTTNYFDVVCFMNNSNIITIYPTMRGEKIPHVDLNYMKYNSKDSAKVKKISQIDKFNRRYKKS